MKTEQTEGWQLTKEGAEIYQQIKVPIFFDPLAHAVLKKSPLKPENSVLDIAAGTGTMARIAAEKLNSKGAVTALEINEAMCNVGRSIKSISSSQIVWKQGDAHNLPFNDNSFNVVSCQQGLQFFSDKTKAINEMYRVLIKNGRALITLYPTQANPYSNALKRILEKFINKKVAAERHTPFSFGDVKEIKNTFSKTHFKNIEIKNLRYTINMPLPENYVMQELISSPIRSHIISLDKNTKFKIVNEVSRELNAYVKGDCLEIPIDSHLVICRKQ